MCIICDRINMIKEETNPWFVKELETGYVVIGDNQHFKGYTLFLCKEHKTELFQLDYSVKMKFLEEMSIVAEAVAKAFHAEKMNYELLGNGDSHIHWHLFPRYNGDLDTLPENCTKINSINNHKFESLYYLNKTFYYQYSDSTIRPYSFKLKSKTWDINKIKFTLDEFLKDYPRFKSDFDPK